MNTAANYSDRSPIGIFDSGFGGLTVLHELIDWLPRENYIFFGDSARCPYGPRSLDEVREFALQICNFLVECGCKLIVIACNTATAAGLAAAQMQFDVPIVGVVEPGARAAVHMTHNRRVGVIATQGTIDSGAYASAIHNLDAGIKVFSKAAPGFVDMAERGVFCLAGNVASSHGQIESLPAHLPSTYNLSKYSEADVNQANEYLAEFATLDIDTLVMGCTHFPLIQDLIANTLPSDVAIVSSAVETAADVYHILKRRDDLNPGGAPAFRRFYTSSSNTEEFSLFGSVVLEGIDVKAQYVSLN